MSSKRTIQIRFLGGKLGKAIADKFEVSTVGDLLYEFTEGLIGADILKMRYVQAHQSRCIQRHQRHHSRVLADPYPSDEMQQKFGEDSIWVYEIIRYTHISVMIVEATEYSTEGSISQKVCNTRRSHPHHNEYNCPV
jgi:hypothetical protein